MIFSPRWRRIPGWRQRARSAADARPAPAGRGDRGPPPDDGHRRDRHDAEGSASGAYFRLSPEGWFLWQRLDGQHTMRDLAMAYMDEFGAFAPQAVTDLVARLAAGGFVKGIPLRADVQRATERTTVGERALLTARRLLEWKVAIRDVDARLTRLYGSLRPLFTPIGLGLLAVLALAGFVAFLLGWSRFHDALHGPGGSAWVLLFLVPAFFLSLLIHEAGHAFAVKHFGYEVPRAGVGWYWFGPMAYVDTSDMWLAPRGPRIAVALAGVAAEAVLAGVAALIAWVVPSLTLAALLWQFALSSYVLILLNLNPLMEFDGYFVLMDWLERPNLRPKALAWLGRGLVPALKRRDLPGCAGTGWRWPTASDRSSTSASKRPYRGPLPVARRRLAGASRSARAGGKSRLGICRAHHRADGDGNRRRPPRNSRGASGLIVWSPEGTAAAGHPCPTEVEAGSCGVPAISARLSS